MPIPVATNDQPPALQRRFSMSVVRMSGVVIILGPGIYMLVGSAAGQNGNGVWLTLFMDEGSFHSGMVLLAIGLVASVVAVRYEREAV